MRCNFFMVLLIFCLLAPCLVHGVSAEYLPPDEFFASEDDFSISVLAVQTTPNTPVTSATGLKGILLQLFGDYSPTITQLRYQANNNSTYTYVNDISPDYPWIWSAVIFSIVLFCVFRLGGALLCRL